MKKKITSILFIVCCFIISTNAQDIHYSQFYASPLTLNPAMTGVFDGNYRVGIMYRNQWASVTPNPYETPSISFDYNGILANKIKKGILSGGLLILDDKAGSGDLSNFTLLASAAYRFFIGQNEKNNISVGLQGALIQKSIDLSALTFQNEYTGDGFNQNLGSGEAGLTNTKSSCLDFNIGALYTSELSKTLDFYGGLALFNFNNPKESFFNADTNNLNPRFVAHGGLRYKLNPIISLLPAALYMYQNKSQEFDVGTSLSYLIKNNINDITLYVGGYYRWQDAIIIMVGAEYRNIRVGLSYDINVSNLAVASNNNGAFEISLNYIGLISKLHNEPPALYCPRY